MIVNRQDAWTEEEDLILAEVTLRHIREGSTQLAAFDEVAQRIGRTPAACGFRWNSDLRKKYETAIQVAKAQRKKYHSISGKRDERGLEEPKETSDKKEDKQTVSVDYSNVIAFLQEQSSYISSLELQVETLKKEKFELSSRLKTMESEYQIVHDDYQILIGIMNRARKMVVDDEVEERPKKYRVDSQGNVESMESS